ncbi:Lrp/AsnC ligand binding domain-containing protein [Ensifer sp. SL37]|nr:Lrp/AsnC ligand binding domain-containing protein [Ensifer sp. SL37]MCY1745246.1 Lrp/AsnC ligand binding domain-containing protein [Ensifer sp. SL37]
MGFLAAKPAGSIELSTITFLRTAEPIDQSRGGFPEISQIHTKNGRWDLLVELNASSLANFDAVLRRIRLVPGTALWAAKRTFFFHAAVDEGEALT